MIQASLSFWTRHSVHQTPTGETGSKVKVVAMGEIGGCYDSKTFATIFRSTLERRPKSP
jgi:hypothetical protein